MNKKTIKSTTLVPWKWERSWEWLEWEGMKTLHLLNEKQILEKSSTIFSE